MKQYWFKFHAAGQRCGYIDSSISVLSVWQFLWNHVVWFIQSQRLCSKHFVMTNKDGAHHPSTSWFFLWRNMKQLHWYTRYKHVGYVHYAFVHPRYNSLGDPTRQYEVWKKIHLNTNWADWSNVRHSIPSN